jgi:hypothetical protein
MVTADSTICGFSLIPGAVSERGVSPADRTPPIGDVDRVDFRAAATCTRQIAD